MTVPGTSTGQQATGRAIVSTIPGVGNFMVWTGVNSYNWINFAVQSSGYSFPQAPNKSFTSKFGPSFVLQASGTAAYVVWADASTSQIMVGTATSSNGAWSLGNQTLTVTGSKAGGGPEAELTLQNGQLVLSILWLDQNLGGIAGCQVPVGTTPSSVPFAALPNKVSCLDTPDLQMMGKEAILAYFDQNRNFNLAVDPQGGVEFTTQLTSTTVQSAFGPAVVPLSTTQAYLFWTAGSGSGATLQYQQLGVNQAGNWVFNPTSGCSGTVSGAVPTGAPYAQVVQVTDPATGDQMTQFLVAWADANGTPANTVSYAYVLPNFAPIPVP